MSNRLGTLVLCGALGVLVGCARSPYVPVEGVILHNGQPAVGYAVLFQPADGKGQAASGRTDTDGSFYLTTIQDRDGTLPGEYKVLVIAPDYRGPTKSNGGKNTPDYTNPATTPLTCKVPSEGKVRFDLTGKPPDEKTGPALLQPGGPLRK